MSGTGSSEISAFIATFCKLYKEHRKASYFVRRPKDLTLIRLLLDTYPADELADMADDLLTVDDEWVGATDRGIGILTVKASWLSNRRAQRQVVVERKVWTCPHEPPCSATFKEHCITKQWWAEQHKEREAS
jgi:hypothetical protein